MVLPRDGLLHEGLLHFKAINHDVVEELLEDGEVRWVLTVNDDGANGWDVDRLQHRIDFPTVPQDSLGGEVVHNKWITQDGIRFRLFERKAFGEPREERVNDGPLFNGLVQDALVPKVNNIKRPVPRERDHPTNDLVHRRCARFTVHRADPDTNRAALDDAPRLLRTL